MMRGGAKDKQSKLLPFAIQAISSSQSARKCAEVEIERSVKG
jgi:hypothetical protein